MSKTHFWLACILRTLVNNTNKFFLFHKGLKFTQPSPGHCSELPTFLNIIENSRKSSKYPVVREFGKQMGCIYEPKQELEQSCDAVSVK